MKRAVTIFLFACARNATETPPASDSPGGRYIEGEKTEIAASSIGAAGGEIALPAGSALEGATLSIEAGVLSGDHRIGISLEGGELTGLSWMRSDGVISIDVDGAAATIPVNVRVPFSLSAPRDVFEIDANGRLFPTTAAVRDGVATFSAATDAKLALLHAPPRSPARQEGAGPLPEEIDVKTAFFSAVNGFAITNAKTSYMGGTCLGMSVFALWYFINGKGALFSAFGGSTPTEVGGGAMDRARVLASRAHSGVSRREAAYSLAGDLNEDASSNLSQLVLIASALQETKIPVLLGVDAETRAHALLALGVRDGYLSYSLPVYDPNFPGQEPLMTVTYDGKVDHSGWRWLKRMGTRSLPTGEAFEDMERDANASFHSENEIKVDVESHESGDTVDRFNVTLQGKVYSGQVLMHDMKIVNTSDHDREVEVQHAEGSEEWTADLELVAGENKLRFTANAYTYSDAPDEAKTRYSEKTFDLTVEMGFAGTVRATMNQAGGLSAVAVMKDVNLTKTDPYDWEQKSIPVEAIFTLGTTTCSSVSELPELHLQAYPDTSMYTLTFSGVMFQCGMTTFVMPGMVTPMQPYEDLTMVQGSADISQFGVLNQHLEWELTHEAAR